MIPDLKPRVPNKKKKNGRRGGQNNSAQPRRRRAPQAETTIESYAAMLADPCNAPLLPGIYGTQEGLLARVKSTLSNDAPATQTCGFVLWAPDYNNDPLEADTHTGYSYANIVYNYGDDAAAPMVNDLVNPYGFSTDPSADSAFVKGIQDPAADLLKSTIVSDARTIGSCITMTYTGALINSGGQYAQLTAIPLTTMLHGGPANAPPSINDLFKYATTTGRIGEEKIEIKGRPDDSSNIFRSNESGPLVSEFIGGAQVRPTFLSTESKTVEPVFFGVVWRGLPTGVTNPMVFDLLKSIEWRPETASGFTQVPKHAYHAQPQAVKATMLLDRTRPHWATKAFQVSRRALSFANSPTGRSLMSTVLAVYNPRHPRQRRLR